MTCHLYDILWVMKFCGGFFYREMVKQRKFSLIGDTGQVTNGAYFIVF